MKRILFLALLSLLNFSTICADGDIAPLSSPMISSNFDCAPPCLEMCCDRFDGLYLGANIGINTHTAYRNDLNSFLAGNSGFTTNKNSVCGGVLIGYDWQCCHKLAGVAFDWSWTNPKRTIHFNTNIPTADESLTDAMRWFATLRGRAGLAFDDVLFYITAGAAVAKFKTNYFSRPAAVASTFNTQNSRWGWVGGVGSEWSFCRNFTFNFELLYLTFASRRFSTVIFGTDLFEFDHADQAFVGRVGINYRFCP